MSASTDIGLTESSGNVFDDLAVEDPEEALVKAKLARVIGTIILSRRMTQTRAAEVLGIDQPKVPALARGRLTGFSIDRLLRFIVALDRDVEISIKPKPRSRPHGRLDVATG
ncbi:MAG: helix-turn-helix transcriptional regulator [Dehalococcoidia bacterium]|nr:helix-turn-helix transcriptional regulator [Dehalococcoidia bacterium]